MPVRAASHYIPIVVGANAGQFSSSPLPPRLARPTLGDSHCASRRGCDENMRTAANFCMSPIGGREKEREVGKHTSHSARGLSFSLLWRFARRDSNVYQKSSMQARTALSVWSIRLVFLTSARIYWSKFTLCGKFSCFYFSREKFAENSQGTVARACLTER